MRKRFKRERRKSPRIEIHFLFKYRVLNRNSGGEILTSSVNISDSGLLGKTPHKLNVNDILLIELNFVGFIEKVISVKGRVVWVSKKRKLWIAGIEFIEIDNEDKDLISKYVESMYYPINNKESLDNNKTE